MAFPVITTNNGGNDTGGTSHTVNLPSGIASGDLLIVVFASDGAPTYTWPTGWNQAANDLFSVANGTAVKMEGKQRVADGTEGSTISVTTGAAEWTAHVTARITGWHGTTPAEAGSASMANKADPPDFNPAAWDVEDTLWLCCGAHDCGGTDNDDITAISGSYTIVHGIKLAGTDAGGVTLGVGQRNVAAASENPGVYTSPTNEEAVAATIAVRPGTGGQTVTPPVTPAAWAVATPTVVKGGVTLTPPVTPAAWAVPTPTVVKGTVTLTPAAVGAAFAVPTPTVVLGAVTLTPPVTGASWAVPTPTVVPGALTLTPAAVVAAWAVPTPTVSQGTTLTPDAVGAAFAVATPTVVLGAVTLTPTAVTAAYVVATPTVVPGALTLTPAAAVAAWAVPTPTVVVTLTPAAVVAAYAVATPTVVLGGLTLTPAAAAATWTVPTPTLVVGAAVLQQEGYRWRNDDGTEAAATAMAPQDEDIVWPVLTTARLRVLVDVTAGNPDPAQFQIEYRRVGAADWRKVPLA